MEINEQMEEMQHEEKNKKRIVILVLCILTILVALIGGSFAYLTASVRTPGGQESITIETVTIEGVTYEASDNLTLLDALPGSSTSTIVTITNPNATAKVRYTLKVVADVNDFSSEDGMGQLLIRAKRGNNETVLDFTDGNVKEQYLVQNIELGPNESNTYQMSLEFVDLGITQNTNQSKNFSAHIEITQSIVIS